MCVLKKKLKEHIWSNTMVKDPKRSFSVLFLNSGPRLDSGEM